jgi:hypothetical protein
MLMICLSDTNPGIFSVLFCSGRVHHKIEIHKTSLKSIQKRRVSAKVLVSDENADADPVDATSEWALL